MKIIVIGMAGHGKDEVSMLLCEYAGLEFESSSQFAVDKGIFDSIIHAHMELPEDKSINQKRNIFYMNKDNFRPEMYKAVREYNSGNLSRLAEGIFSEYDIYCGLRHLEEFEDIMSKGLADLVIFVDAVIRKGVTETMSSFTIPRSRADIIIDNNGTKEELRNKIQRLVEVLKITK